MTERALQAKVMRELKKQGCDFRLEAHKTWGGVWDNNSPSPWSKRGIADITGCYWHERHYGGQFAAIELKQPGKYKDPHAGLTMEQIAWLEAKKSAGAVCIIADSWETVESCLRHGHGNFNAEIALQLHHQQQESRASKRRVSSTSGTPRRNQSSRSRRTQTSR